jgi:5'(3')-deoxyribonucleotidase
VTVQHLTLVIDLDGVCADFHGALIEHVGPPRDIRGWGFEEWYPEAALREKAEAFTADPESYRNLALLPACKKTLNALHNAGHRLIAVTARPKEAEEVTKEWCHRNLRGLFHEIRVVGPEEKVGKILDIHPHLILDDNSKTCQALREKGLYAIMFSQPWNMAAEGNRTMGWTHFRKGMCL